MESPPAKHTSVDSSKEVGSSNGRILNTYDQTTYPTKDKSSTSTSIQRSSSQSPSFYESRGNLDTLAAAALKPLAGHSFSEQERNQKKPQQNPPTSHHSHQSNGSHPNSQEHSLDSLKTKEQNHTSTQHSHHSSRFHYREHSQHPSDEDSEEETLVRHPKQHPQDSQLQGYQEEKCAPHNSSRSSCESFKHDHTIKVSRNPPASSLLGDSNPKQSFSRKHGVGSNSARSGDPLDRSQRDEIVTDGNIRQQHRSTSPSQRSDVDKQSPRSRSNAPYHDGHLRKDSTNQMQRAQHLIRSEKRKSAHGEVASNQVEPSKRVAHDNPRSSHERTASYEEPKNEAQGPLVEENKTEQQEKAKSLTPETLEGRDKDTSSKPVDAEMELNDTQEQAESAENSDSSTSHQSHSPAIPHPHHLSHPHPHPHQHPHQHVHQHPYAHPHAHLHNHHSAPVFPSHIHPAQHHHHIVPTLSKAERGSAKVNGSHHHLHAYPPMHGHNHPHLHHTLSHNQFGSGHTHTHSRSSSIQKSPAFERTQHERRASNTPSQRDSSQAPASTSAAPSLLASSAGSKLPKDHPNNSDPSNIEERETRSDSQPRGKNKIHQRDNDGSNCGEGATDKTSEVADDPKDSNQQDDARKKSPVSSTLIIDKPDNVMPVE
ncbi:hypothetical protein BGZ76_003368 [Entomortierella beljakovae]|nr:hypothetical protein BGZ76_003368 [Entomortierella beljakovae]